MLQAFQSAQQIPFPLFLNFIFRSRIDLFVFCFLSFIYCERVERVKDIFISVLFNLSL